MFDLIEINRTYKQYENYIEIVEILTELLLFCYELDSNIFNIECSINSENNLFILIRKIPSIYISYSIYIYIDLKKVVLYDVKNTIYSDIEFKNIKDIHDYNLP